MRDSAPHPVRTGLVAARTIATLLALFSIALPASAQQPLEQLPGRLEPATRVAIERVADSLRAAGLPDAPVYSKAAEGVLKRADDARILEAVRSLAHDLAVAREALDASASDAEIVAGASALHAGVEAAELRRMRERQPGVRGRSLAIPLTVLADLVTRGVPPNDAASSVNALLTRRVDDAEFQALRVGVEHEISAGRPPGAAAQAWTKRVLQELPPDARPGVPQSDMPR